MSASAALLHDPFGPAASVAAYVPYAACERALAALERLLERPGCIVALVGPPGLGKTLLLHRAALRAGDRLRSAYLPFCTLSLEELCAFALDLLEIEAEGDPVAALSALARASAADGSGVLLLIDDVGALPVETAESLAALVAQLGGALSLVCAAVDSAETQRVFAALGDRLTRVELSEGMSEGESRRYVETRLAVAGAPGEVCALFDEPAIQILHRESQGVPRRLNLAAQARLRDALGAEPVPVIGSAPAAAVEPPAAGPASGDALAGDAALIDTLVRAAERMPRRPLPRAETPAARTGGERAPAARGELTRLGTYRYAKGRAIDDEAAPTEKPPPAEPPRSGDEHVDRTLTLLVESSAPPPVFEARPVEASSTERLSGSAPTPPARRRSIPGVLLGAVAVAAAFVAGLYVTLGQDLAPHVPAGPRAVPTQQEPVTESVPEPGAPAAAIPFAPETGAATVPSSPEAAVAEIGNGPEAVPTAIEPEAVEPVPAHEVVEAPPEPVLEVEPETPPPPIVEAEREAPPEPVAEAEPSPAPRVTTPEPSPPEPAAALAAVAPSSPPAPEAPEAVAALPGPAPIHAVSINARPWAVVEVDGRELGETPLAGVELEEGLHRFRARMPDGSVRERSVEIDADNRFVVFE